MDKPKNSEYAAQVAQAKHIMQEDSAVLKKLADGCTEKVLHENMDTFDVLDKELRNKK